jgi:hypothetical protein
MSPFTYMPANNPIFLFITLIIVAWLWTVFSSLNALRVANIPSLGGCCSTNKCGEAPVDIIMYRMTLTIAVIMTLVLAASVYYFFKDRKGD